jgi:GTP-binding protein Era
MDELTHCGYVALVGRPNVGKSTLLNQLLSRKVSITSRKPQTTRQSILGIKTEGSTQIVYVDTPGLQIKPKRLIHQYMNRAASTAMYDVNIIIFVVEPIWREEDQWILDQIKNKNAIVFLVINKIDRLSNRDLVLPYIDQVSRLFNFQEIIPICAKTGDRVFIVEQQIQKYLPVSPFYFAADQVTDRDDQFMASEIIREKLMRLLGQEIPHALAVTILMFEVKTDIIRISAIIWVEKRGQKIIVIGKGGEKLKAVGTQARLDLETLFGKKVFLQLWVKIKSDWSDNEKSLQSFGFR